MNGFIMRVCAYHGEPVTVGGLPVRAGYNHDEPVTKEKTTNDPINESIRDLSNGGKESSYGILQLVEDFEDEYGCKVNFDDPPTAKEGNMVFEFDIFEPTWPTVQEAKDVIDDLTRRLVDWVEGYPTGR